MAPHATILAPYTAPAPAPSPVELDWMFLVHEFTGTSGCVPVATMRDQVTRMIEHYQSTTRGLHDQMEQTQVEHTAHTAALTADLQAAQDKASTTTALAFAAVMVAAVMAALLVRSTRQLRALTLQQPDPSADDDGPRVTVLAPEPGDR